MQVTRDLYVAKSKRLFSVPNLLEFFSSHLTSLTTLLPFLEQSHPLASVSPHCVSEGDASATGDKDPDLGSLTQKKCVSHSCKVQ